MPTYAYRCTACGTELEAKQSFSDASLTVCPECGGALRKLFGSVGVMFKGSGFYRNDSRASSGSAKSSPSESSKGSKSSDSGGSDSSSSGGSSSSDSSSSGSSSGSSSSAAKSSSA